ncbi:hypothetical protein [Streptomyces lydicus]|uniref:hypothetical protein n=1 Tax=Streptomyces lydicus TaxID=47763 RepID=UPI0037A1447B
MVKTLGDSASELGGGHARHLALRYLTQDVAPGLEGRVTETTGRELFTLDVRPDHREIWRDLASTPGADLVRGRLA